MRLIAAFSMVSTLLFSTAAMGAGIEVSNAFARATPTGVHLSAGYAAVKNSGTEPDELIGAHFASASYVEIHEMKLIDGVMSMRAIKKIDLPAGATIELKPGSTHLMLMNLRQPLVDGQVVQGDLVFAKAGAVPVEFRVEAMQAPHGR